MNTEKTNIHTNVDAAEIPENVFESLARSLLPVIQKYYESEDAKRHLPNGRQQSKRQAKHRHKATGRTALIGSPPGFFYYQSSISSIETTNPNP